MRLRRATVCALLPLLASLFSASPPAQAAVYSCGSQGNWFGGHIGQNNPRLIEGVAGNLTYQGILLCGSDPNGGSNYASGWYMIASPSCCGYMQTGFIYRFGDPCMRHFSEERQNSSTGWYDVYGSCASPGEVHTQYDYVWQDSGGAYHGAMVIDATVFAIAGWSPFENWGTPFVPQFNGEVSHPGSDIPGTAGSEILFNGIADQDWNNNWYPGCYMQALTYASPSLNKFSSTSDGCSWVKSWTNNPNGAS